MTGAKHVSDTWINELICHFVEVLIDTGFKDIKGLSIKEKAIFK